MMLRRTSFTSVALAVLLWGALQTKPVLADGKPLAIGDLQAIVSGMGLQDEGDKKTFVSIPHQGKSDLTVMLYPFDDGKNVLVYSNLTDVPADKTASMPMQKMLEYNDILDHRFYFAFDADGKALYLLARVNADAVSPRTLRQKIDSLVDEADNTKDLWTVDKWAATPTPGGDQDYHALQDAADAAWTKAPLALDHVGFTQDKVEEYGAYTVRASTAFTNKDVAHLYLEPVHYVWKSRGDRGFGFGFAADLVVRKKGGDAIIDKKDIINTNLSAYNKLKTADITLNITLDGFPTGADYEATVTVRDLNSAKVATTTIPFSVTK